jgi:hypothetical protein
MTLEGCMDSRDDLQAKAKAETLANKMIEEVKKMQFLSSHLTGVNSKDLQLMALDRDLRDFFGSLETKKMLLNSVTDEYKKAQTLGNTANNLLHEVNDLYKSDKYFEFTQKYPQIEPACILFRKQLVAQQGAGKHLVPDMTALEGKIDSIIKLLDSKDVKSKIDTSSHTRLVVMCNEAKGLVTSLMNFEKATTGLKAKTNELNIHCANGYKSIKDNAIQVAQAIQNLKAKQNAAQQSGGAASVSNNPPPVSHLHGSAQAQARQKAQEAAGRAVHPAPSGPEVKGSK